MLQIEWDKIEGPARWTKAKCRGLQGMLDEP